MSIVGCVWSCVWLCVCVFVFVCACGCVCVYVCVFCVCLMSDGVLIALRFIVCSCRDVDNLQQSFEFVMGKMEKLLKTKGVWCVCFVCCVGMWCEGVAVAWLVCVGECVFCVCVLLHLPMWRGVY